MKNSIIQPVHIYSVTTASILIFARDSHVGFCSYKSVTKYYFHISKREYILSFRYLNFICSNLRSIDLLFMSGMHKFGLAVRRGLDFRHELKNY